MNYEIYEPEDDSYLLQGFVQKHSKGTVLDMGTGSGIQAISALDSKNVKKVYAQLNKLWWLLLGGTIFALVNNIPIIYKFYTRPIGSFASCSAGTVTNPYVTSCFLGFSAFFLALIFATLIKRAAKR